MSIEDELLRLARDRERKSQDTLDAMLLERPDRLGRQLRAYLSRQADHGRMKHTNEKIPAFATIGGGVSELACPQAEFSSGSRLTFKVQAAEEQRGWLVKRFQFHLHLPATRRIRMVRIHLNEISSHDPLAVPRCHMHIADSEAHVPFPIMDPRLILYLICEHIEPDFGT